MSSVKTLFLFIAPLLALNACSNHEIPPANTLTVALSSEPKTLDPRYATDANGMRITGLLFNSIVKLGPDLNIVGDAAKHWEYQPLRYTFYLKSNLSFADGAPVTKADLEFSIAEYKKDKSAFKSALDPIEKVEVEGDNTQGFVIKLYLSKFSATLLTDLTPIKILPKHLVEKLGDDFNQNPIGTGSFALKERSANQIVLQAQKSHSFAPPKVDTLIFKIIQNDATRYLKILKGAIDIAQAEVPPSKVIFFKKRDEFQVYEYPGLSMTYLLLNLKDKDLQKIELRQALDMGINRSEIIEYKLEGLASPATSILSPTSPFFNKELIPTGFDPAQAKQRVSELGLMGKTLTLKTSNNQTAVENGKVIAKQLENIGIKVMLQSFEWGTFYGDIQAGNFQLALMRWVGATDPDIYRMALHSREVPPGRNRGYYINPKVDKLLDDGIHIEDAQKRIAHYQEVQKLVYQDLAMIPLWYDTQVAIVHKRVKNFSPPKNGDFSALIQAEK